MKILPLLALLLIINPVLGYEMPVSSQLDRPSSYIKILRPDLELSIGEVNIGEHPGDRTRIEDLCINNIGRVRASPIQFYYSFNAVPQTNAEKSVLSIIPGGSNCIDRLDYTYEQAGNHTFRFVVDQNNLVDEINEENNELIIPIEIVERSLPDLMISNSWTNEPHEAITEICFDISNIGTLGVSDYDYYIDYGDGNGEFNQVIVTINPGETKTLCLTHEYDHTNSYNVNFEINPFRSFEEINYGNNDEGINANYVIYEEVFQYEIFDNGVPVEINNGTIIINRSDYNITVNYTLINPFNDETLEYLSVDIMFYTFPSGQWQSDHDYITTLAPSSSVNGELIVDDSIPESDNSGRLDINWDIDPGTGMWWLDSYYSFNLTVMS